MGWVVVVSTSECRGSTSGRSQSRWDTRDCSGGQVFIGDGACSNFPVCIPQTEQ